MKIVHFCADLSPWNGMANTARQFVAEETAQGHESVLTDDLAELRIWLAKAEAGLGADVAQMRLHIHGTWRPILWRAVKLAKRYGAEVVVRPAGNYDPLRRRQGGWKRFKKWAVGPWERTMLHRADVIQATCEAEAGWIREYLGGCDKVQITDLKRFFKIGGGDNRGCDATTRNKSLHLLFLGRAADPLKGVRFLERAVGEINAEERMEESRLCLRIASNHTGEELERDWEWCDVLCLPTLSENFGRVVAEALERGKRVITTDGAPAWEDWGKGEKEEVRREKEEVRREKEEVGLEKGEVKGFVYLRGYRDGSDARRVELLKAALREMGAGSAGRDRQSIESSPKESLRPPR